MKADRTLEDLWSTAPTSPGRFDPARTAALPPPARRWLWHALAPGAPLARAARLHMTGSLRLGGTWLPMEAEQVTLWDRGFHWQARVRLKGVPISGYDELIDGVGAMRWRLLGLVPFVTKDGLDVTRSAAGRMNGEAVWLPAVLLDDGVAWEEVDGGVIASFRAHGETTRLHLGLADDGALRSVAFPRWGETPGTPPHEDVFGGCVLAEATFGGLTIPSDVELGWWPSTDRFDAEGCFFRATIDRAEFR